MRGEIRSGRRARAIERFIKERAKRWSFICLDDIAQSIAEIGVGPITSYGRLASARDLVWSAIDRGVFEIGGRSMILFVNPGTGAIRFTMEFAQQNLSRTRGSIRAAIRETFVRGTWVPSSIAKRLYDGYDLVPPGRFSEHFKNAVRLTAKRKHERAIRFPTRKSRGPRPLVSERVESQMRLDLTSEGGREKLAGMKDIGLHQRYGAAASTCRPLRRKLLAE